MTIPKRIKWQFLPGSIHNMYRATDGDLAYTLQVKGTGDAGQTVLIKRSNSPADEEVWDVAAVSGLALIVESQVLYDSLSKGAVAVMPTTTPK